MRQIRTNKKPVKLFKTDNDLKNALNKLKGDGIDLKIIETNKGDNFFIICSKNLETKIGVNELGFWLVEQVAKNNG